MTREEIILELIELAKTAKTPVDGFHLIADWHIAEIEPLRQSLEKLLRRNKSMEFTHGKDCYIQVDINDMNNALNLLKLAGKGT